MFDAAENTCSASSVKGRKTRKAAPSGEGALPGKGLAPRRKPATPEEPQPLFPCLTARRNLRHGYPRASGSRRFC